ncbi:hypothetical protein G5B38_15655 [Pseudohalocynthiibacter aestuariivivens]|nr:ankyrin repeat domain-containing protein [Pseudohalocynthiibacter aestuariivivens]QIE46841.1 hypothetical protein G5B38_15655 [Pseudohalocynthiibacter aestuariivivens]
MSNIPDTPASTLDALRRQAKVLRRAYEAGAPAAIARLRAAVPRGTGDLKHADFLHVIAREQGFPSWPKLKWADETIGLSRAQRQARLRAALMQGQHWIVQQLLEATPDLADGDLGAQIALYDRAAVAAALVDDPTLAVWPSGPRTPILHLTFSRHIVAAPDKAVDMFAIAEMLVAHGADVNDAVPVQEGVDHPLSALYGALSHARNMPLARWLLEQGADPNDGESLYHATELGHCEGLEMLLAHGADPRGTNALLRAMDFDDPEAVRMILAAGADDQIDRALHHAAIRRCGKGVIAALLEAGADPAHVQDGASAYGAACVYGNTALKAAIEAVGPTPPLSRDEQLMAAAAEGQDSLGEFIDPAGLPMLYRDIIREIIAFPDVLGHIRRLVALGVEYDKPAALGVTPVQIAGWEGLPEVMGYLLSLKPDLSHVNDYGGKLLGAILHGSEKPAKPADRDHVACARMALEEGVALPRWALREVGDEAMADFLAGWAEAHPGQVVEGDG